MGAREITLRFMAAPTDVAALGESAVAGGRVLEWIDKAAYACAVGWSGGYCVTAYVGNVNFARPIQSGDVVEVQARLVHTGRSSMHVEVAVSSADPQHAEYVFATSCTVIFVAVGGNGRPVPVNQWVPLTDDDRGRDAMAVDKTSVRADIEASMKEQSYTEAGTALERTLRFLAAPSDVNWGGKVHGGTVMRWIDEAAYVCAAGWNRGPTIAVYAGGVRFYRPLLIGSVVEVRARLVHTGRHSMHISVHVRSGDPKTTERELTTHCMMIFVALDEERRSALVRQWAPVSEEDVALDAHARQLIELRSRADLLDRELPRAAR